MPVEWSTLNSLVVTMLAVGGALWGFYLHMSGLAQKAREVCDEELRKTAEELWNAITEVRRDYVRRDDFFAAVVRLEAEQRNVVQGLNGLAARIDLLIRAEGAHG